MAMKAQHAFPASMLAVLLACPLAAQVPALSSIEAPYVNLQSQVKMAGTTYGAGAVAYGPAGTPLTLGGSNFGSSGTVQFVPYANGVAGTPVQATVTTWTSTILSVTVPAGAASGLVTVTSGGATSNGLPFIVMQGTYSDSCPAAPPGSQLQIVTSGLAAGAAGQPYSETLEATGGLEPYAWTITSGSLPAGLSLDASTGAISGTPTAASGPTNLTVQVADSASPSQTDSAVLSLTVDGSGGTSATVYSYSIAYDAAGNVTAYDDSVNGFWTMTTGEGLSGYDWLHRLEAAQAIAGPYAGLQVNWDYDSFGNRTEESFGGSPSGNAPIPASSSVSYNANNQATAVSGGFAPEYDAAGDVLCDSYDSGTSTCHGNQYLYDADGRVCAVSTLSSGMWGYLYDAEGHRIAKGTITSMSCDTTENGFTPTASYILGPDNQQLTELSWSGGTAQWSHSNVWAAGQLIATYSADSGGQTAGVLSFELGDWLGTRRVLTDYAGNVKQSCESLPYGNGETCAPLPTEHLFTQHERDAETDNDYFGARYYSSDAGRFLSPDWSAKVEPVPYSKLENPQTLNLYAYVGDNPLNGSDEFGHSSQQLCTPNGGNCSSFNDNTDTAQQAQQQNVNNNAVGGTTVGNLGKVLTNEIGSLSTPKGGNPKELQNGANAIANALIDNAHRTRPNGTAPDTGTASSFLSQIMQSAYTNRANGGADPVQGRTFYGTSHIPPSRLLSRPIGSGRQTVYEHFGPFNDSVGGGRQTWIYIYNDPGH